MKTLKTRWIVAAALGLMAAGGASAQGTWNLGGSVCNASGTPGAATCKAGQTTGSGFDATMKAYSNVGGSFVQINLANNDPSGFGGMSQAVGGFVAEANSPDHAFDNMAAPATGREGGTHEFMLIDFGSNKVNLSSLSVGWSDGQADMSIYRWDGAAVNVSGSSLNSSWSLVSSMDAWNNGVLCDNPNDATEALGAKCRRFDASAGTVGAGGLNKYSSWWLISTYTGSATTSGLDALKNDSFKLLNFAATICAGTLSGGSTGGGSTQNNGNGASCATVPEPGSLALVGLALTGVYAVRRRRFGWAPRLAA